MNTNKDMHNLLENSKISSGILIELHKGDSEQHTAILKKENERLNGRIDLADIKIIADSDCSIFEKLGCLKTLIAYHDALDGNLDTNLVQKIISRTLNILSTRDATLWKTFIDKAKLVVPESQFCWLNGLRFKSFEIGNLVIEASSRFYVEQFEERLIKELTPVFKEVFGENVHLSYSFSVNTTLSEQEDSASSM